MKSHRKEFTIEKMCQVLKVGSSGYYHWLDRPISQRSWENMELLEGIKLIYQQSMGRYGSPRITAKLNKLGTKASRPRVARLMKKAGIRSITKKKYRVTTDSAHRYPLAENLLNRDFSAGTLGQKWVGDMTYIRTKEGWQYLTTVIDLADRKVIGWAQSSTMSANDTTVAAWKMAIKNRPVTEGLLFHSDRGIQYACNEFKDELKKYKAIQSMSRKGNCWDNAVAESFFKSLKTEMVYHNRFNTREEAKRAIFEYIEVWYNRKRIHSALGYLTPCQMEKQIELLTNRKTA